MDKKKIISSLALAGILTASVLGANVNASTADEYVKPVGVYKQLIAGKTVVPYVFENSDLKVTVKDVKNEFGNIELVNGNAVTDENYVMKTGETFKANGVEYTVVIYGDANKTGEVSTRDALKIQELALNENADSIEKLVSDLDVNGEISTLDALRVQQFVLGKATVVKEVPPAEEPEIDSIYTVSVNDNGYINAQTASSTVIKISVSETFDELKRLTIKLTDIEGNEARVSVKLNAHTNYVEQSLSSSTTGFTNLVDGKITGQLLERDKVVGSFTTEKNTTVPNAIKVLTNRVNTKSATLSLDACGDSDIVKVYYKVQKTSEPELDDGDEDELVNTIEVSGNSISNVTVANDLETKEAYKVYYMLENSYGSKSAIKSVVITSDSEDVTKAEKVEEITAPDLAKVEGDKKAEFSWEGIQDKDYIAILYKDGKAVAEKTAKNDSGTKITVDFKAEMATEGTYKIAVYVPASDSEEASEITESAEVKVAKLATVTDLKFVNEDNKIMLKWANSNNKDSFKDYTIKLYTINEKGEEVLSYTVSPAVTSDKNEVEVTSHIEVNKIYVAKVMLNPIKNQLASIASDETVSEQFYIVGTPSIRPAETLENEVTLNATGISINGKTATYKVNIYDVNESGSPEEAEYIFKSTKDVELKDGKIVIDGLESNSPYVFKLVAVIDGKEVESDYSDVVRTIPELKSLTIVGKQEDAKEAGKVFSVDADTIVMEEKTIDLSDYNSTKLANAMKIINVLKAGDVVTIENEKIILKLDGGASASDASRNLSSLSGLEKITLEIESNDFNKIITTPQVKEVILRGTNSIFTVEDVNAEKITLTDGVEVVGEKTFTVTANSTVIINGAKVTTEKETEIAAGTNKLTVTVNEEVNNLVFENKKGTKLTIDFVGLPDHTSVQSGSIVIKSNGGKVTVKSDTANVNAELTVEVNAGDVDIKSQPLTGDKNVTVTLAKGESSTINALSATKAPVALSNVSVDITDEELLKLPNVNEDNLADVKEFLASFGLGGTNATITTGTNNEVTITFTSVTNAINGLVIKNLK